MFKDAYDEQFEWFWFMIDKGRNVSIQAFGDLLGVLAYLQAIDVRLFFRLCSNLTVISN